VGKLAARGFRTGDRISANFYENGYSAAAILLLAAMIESMLQRDHYFFQRAKPNALQVHVSQWHHDRIGVPGDRGYRDVSILIIWKCNAGDKWLVVFHEAI